MRGASPFIHHLFSLVKGSDLWQYHSMSKRRDKPYTGRDWNLVRLLQGATKAGIHTDQKKEYNRRWCRDDSETYSDDAALSIEGGGCDPEGWEALEDRKDPLSGSS